MIIFLYSYLSSDVFQSPQTIQIIEYKFQRFAYQFDEGTYQLIKYDILLISKQNIISFVNRNSCLFICRFNYQLPFSSLHALNYALPNEVYHNRMTLFGSNIIQVQVPSFWKLLVDEVLNPFYCFQLFSVILWFFERYWIYSLAIIVLSISSAVMSVKQTKSNLTKLRSMARLVTDVRRSFDLTTLISSNELVPGDIIEITDDLLLPCDAVLLGGSVVCDESMLTG